MALPLDVSRLPRDIQYPFDQVSKEFPLGSQHLQDNAVDDRVLASPHTQVWHTLMRAGLLGAFAAGTYHHAITGQGHAQGTNHVLVIMPDGFMPLRASDYAVDGKLTKLRIAVMTYCNGTAPANTWTHTLYPIGPGGGAGALGLNFGAAVAGSAVAVVNPLANVETITYGTEFDFPADRGYGLGFVSSGVGAANSVREAFIFLQVRHV